MQVELSTDEMRLILMGFGEAIRHGLFTEGEKQTARALVERLAAQEERDDDSQDT